MEKSNKNNFNADDFSINSVYLDTFRKRKKKNSQKSVGNGLNGIKFDLGTEMIDVSVAARQAASKMMDDQAPSKNDDAKVIRSAEPVKKSNLKEEGSVVSGEELPLNEEGIASASVVTDTSLQHKKSGKIQRQQSAQNDITSNYKVIASTAMLMVSQMFPAIYKTIYDTVTEKNAWSDKNSIHERNIELEAATSKDEKDLTFEIDLLKIFRYLLQRWKSLLLVTLLGGILGFSIASFLLTPKYTATADLYITNKNNIDASTVNISDINASQKLVDTYIVMLQTNSITDEVLNRLGDSNLTEKQLLKYISFSSLNKTEMLEITVETESPELSLKICEAYADIASKALEDIVGSGSVRILGFPKKPTAPSFPSVPKFTVLMAFFSLVFLVLFYVILLATKTTISDEKSLAEKYAVPVLGSVPDFFKFAKVLGISKKDVNLNNKLKKSNVDNEKIVTAATLLDQNTPFPITSAYNMIRTNIMFSMSTMNNGVIVITSPTANDLKTTTTINLAISMAQIGAKVLLVDADLRNPSIYRYFKVGNKHGLSRVLMDFETFDDAVIRDIRPGVDFLSAGPSTPSPAELLGSGYMIEFIKNKADEYDFVFIDTSPINLVSDSLILSSKASGIILTARENKTKYPELDRAIKSISMAKANLLGFILTDADSSSGGYGYGHYGYGYGYGESSNGKKKKTKKNDDGIIDDHVDHSGDNVDEISDN